MTFNDPSIPQLPFNCANFGDTRNYENSTHKIGVSKFENLYKTCKLCVPHPTSLKWPISGSLSNLSPTSGYVT